MLSLQYSWLHSTTTMLCRKELTEEAAKKAAEAAEPDKKGKDKDKKKK